METDELYQVAKDRNIPVILLAIPETDLCASNRMGEDVTSEWIAMQLTERQNAEYTWHMSWVTA